MPRYFVSYTGHQNDGQSVLGRCDIKTDDPIDSLRMIEVMEAEIVRNSKTGLADAQVLNWQRFEDNDSDSTKP